MRRDFAIEYDKIFGQTCRGIYGKGALFCDDETKSFEAVTIELDTHQLNFRVCADSDEIIYDIVEREGEKSEDLSNILFEEFIGNELGYIWSANNWCGHEDMIVISFEGVDPNILFVGVSSMIRIYRAAKIKFPELGNDASQELTG
ncbi:DUF6334 family protein [Caulobacter sp. Root1472]|uniref:DUF6334 family protein n=1 Tax=Caulobacter sp. Root1472 TaxID=1736470 RepID=UPI0012E3D02D|nr:DUF6334 family protein [Caulobacter sp. Root1472]